MLDSLDEVDSRLRVLGECFEVLVRSTCLISFLFGLSRGTWDWTVVGACPGRRVVN